MCVCVLTVCLTVSVSLAFCHTAKQLKPGTIAPKPSGNTQLPLSLHFPLPLLLPLPLPPRLPLPLPLPLPLSCLFPCPSPGLTLPLAPTTNRLHVKHFRFPLQKFQLWLLFLCTLHGRHNRPHTQQHRTCHCHASNWLATSCVPACLRACVRAWVSGLATRFMYRKSFARNFCRVHKNVSCVSESLCVCVYVACVCAGSLALVFFIL